MTLTCLLEHARINLALHLQTFLCLECPSPHFVHLVNSLFILQNLVLTRLILKASRPPFLPNKSETICLVFYAAFYVVWTPLLSPSLHNRYHCATSFGPISTLTLNPGSGSCPF